MIEWIEEAGKTYGIAARRIILGGYWYRAGGTEKFHFDGAAARSIVSKILEEREGASSGRVRQHFPEVLTGKALEFRIATHGCRIEWHDLILYRYVIPNRLMHPKLKLEALRARHPVRFRSRQAYYTELDRLHAYALGRWPGGDDASAAAESVATK